MGILDDAGNLFNRGVASAGRTTRSISLKSQISDLNKRRETLMAQFGANLFEEFRNDPKYRVPNESIYFAVDNLDQQIAALQSELAALEQQAQAAAQPQPQPVYQPSGPTIACPTCGNRVPMQDTFCSGCGTNVQSVKQSVRLCTNCGFVLGANDRFCTNCGFSFPEAVVEPAVVPVAAPMAVPIAEPVVEQAAAPIAEPVIAPVAEQQKTCSACGFANVPAAMFCIGCGNRL